MKTLTFLFLVFSFFYLLNFFKCIPSIVRSQSKHIKNPYRKYYKG